MPSAPTWRVSAGRNTRRIDVDDGHRGPQCRVARSRGRKGRSARDRQCRTRARPRRTWPRRARARAPISSRSIPRPSLCVRSGSPEHACDVASRCSSRASSTNCFPIRAWRPCACSKRPACDVEFPGTQTCCGQPAFTAGEPDAAARLVGSPPGRVRAVRRGGGAERLVRGDGAAPLRRARARPPRRGRRARGADLRALGVSRRRVGGRRPRRPARRRPSRCTMRAMGSAVSGSRARLARCSGARARRSWR